VQSPLLKGYAIGQFATGTPAKDGTQAQAQDKFKANV
jgi:hypothetical protein